MTHKSISIEKNWSISNKTRAILLALAAYLIWTLATYLLEGRVNLLQEPTLIGRYTYVLIANVLIGTVGALWVMRLWLNSQFLTRIQAGFRSLRRTIVTAGVVSLAGFGLVLAQQPAGLTPIVLLNGFAQTLPVSIAEVLVCWVVIGASFETLARPKGKVLAIGVGIVMADVLFTVYHVGHSAPFNQLPMLLLLLLPGLVTSLVYFLGRELYATILIQNFLATIGVLGNIQDLTFLSQPLYSFYLLAFISILVLLGADLLLVRRSKGLEKVGLGSLNERAASGSSIES